MKKIGKGGNEGYLIVCISLLENISQKERKRLLSKIFTNVF